MGMGDSGIQDHTVTWRQPRGAATVTDLDGKPVSTAPVTELGAADREF
jgi:hypothetical protein